MHEHPTRQQARPRDKQASRQASGASPAKESPPRVPADWSALAIKHDAGLGFEAPSLQPATRRFRGPIDMKNWQAAFTCLGSAAEHAENQSCVLYLLCGQPDQTNQIVTLVHPRRQHHTT